MGSRAARGPININTSRRARLRASIRIRRLIHTLVIPTRLVCGTAQKSCGSLADNGCRRAGGGIAEIIRHADPIAAFLVGSAAVCAVDVVAKRGAKITGVCGIGILVNTLIRAAGLVFGAAEEAELGMADGGAGSAAQVGFGRLFRETFSGAAVFVGGAAVAAVEVLAEVFVAVASFRGKDG